MSKTVKTQKRGPKPKKRESVVLRLRAAKRATSKELGVATAYMHSLLRAGLVAQADFAPVNGRGRPAVVWSLSKSGQGTALNLARKSA